jgi:hypothetical protein
LESRNLPLTVVVEAVPSLQLMAERAADGFHLARTGREGLDD